MFKYEPNHWYLILHILKSNNFYFFIDFLEIAAFEFVDTATGCSTNLAVHQFSSLLYNTVIKILKVVVSYIMSAECQIYESLCINRAFYICSYTKFFYKKIKYNISVLIHSWPIKINTATLRYTFCNRVISQLRIYILCVQEVVIYSYIVSYYIKWVTTSWVYTIHM